MILWPWEPGGTSLERMLGRVVEMVKGPRALLPASAAGTNRMEPGLVIGSQVPGPMSQITGYKGAKVSLVRNIS